MEWLSECSREQDRAYLRCAGDVEVDVVERPGRAAGGVGFGVGQLCDVEGVQAVDVLVLGDGVEDHTLVDVCRQGQLYQNTVDHVVCRKAHGLLSTYQKITQNALLTCVQLMDLGEELFL
jgi:hypothetical protein